MNGSTWVAFFVYLVVCLGPLRRGFLGQWRFTVPASVVGWVAFFITASIREPTEPWGMPLAVAAFVALGAGAAGKQWLDEQLRKE